MTHERRVSQRTSCAASGYARVLGMALDPALDPQLGDLIALIASAGHPPMWQGTVEQARRGYRTLCVDLRDDAVLPEVYDVRDITVPGAAGDLAARVYRPTEGPLPTTVFFHGGGWVIGDLDTHDLACRQIARECETVVVSVDYRLAPEHRFPAAVEDAIASARWVAEHTGDFGGTDRVGVAGDSAGGNLSAVVAQVFRDEQRPLAGQLLIYPATDAGGDFPSHRENADGYFMDTASVIWFLQQYAGLDADLTDPRLSPAHGDLTGLAPAVIAAAAFDPLRDHGTSYAEKLQAAGVEVELLTFPGLIHGFIDMGRFSKAAQAALEEIYATFRGVLHGSRH